MPVANRNRTICAPGSVGRPTNAVRSEPNTGRYKTMASFREQSGSIQTARPEMSGPSDQPRMRALAGLGLIARGVVYGVIGILSLKLALGSGGQTESQTGALQTVANQTFGSVLLIALAIGLAAYVTWRLIDGLSSSDHERNRTAQRRIAAIGSAAAYAVLAYVAVTIIAGSNANGGGSPRHATAGVLAWPGGTVIVGAAGLILIGAGAYQAYKGVTRKFLDDSHTERMGPGARRAFSGLGVAGHVARAVTFALVGYGLIKAAVDYSAKSAIGLDGALQKLAHASDGPVLLGTVAVGFIAFALYSITDSHYCKL